MRVRLAGTTGPGDIEPTRRLASAQLPFATPVWLLDYPELNVAFHLDPTRLLRSRAASVPPSEVHPSLYLFGPVRPRFLLSGNVRRRPLGCCLVVQWRDRDVHRMRPTLQPVPRSVTG